MFGVETDYRLYLGGVLPVSQGETKHGLTSSNPLFRQRVLGCGFTYFKSTSEEQLGMSMYVLKDLVGNAVLYFKVVKTEPGLIQWAWRALIFSLQYS